MVATNTAGSRKVFLDTMKAARIGERDAQYEVGLMYANGVGVPQDLQKAVEWIGKAAQRGLPAAQYLLATRYAGGIAVQQDERAALWWYLNAAEQGHTKAQFKLGQLLQQPLQQAAKSSIRQAAEQGLPEAQCELGRSLTAGNPDEAQLQEGVEWTRRAAAHGLAAAQCALADLYASGHGLEKDLQVAMTWYRRAAKQNYPQAQVALEYLNKSGGQRNRSGKKGAAERRATQDRWLRAAEAGDADTKYYVGLMHDLALGVEQNTLTALSHYLSAARHGHPKAQTALGSMLEASSPQEALTWYEKAARSGEADAQFALANLLCHLRGGGPVPLEALQWYWDAARSGHAGAQLALAQHLQNGVEPVAVEYLERAARQGNAEAQFLLGQRFSSGEGLERDATRAAYWWGQASQQGHIEATGVLGVAVLSGNGVARDVARAVELLETAANAGNARAQWNLGGLYASNLLTGGPDLRGAFAWCHKAAEQGFVPAQATLGVLYERIDKMKESVHWLQQAALQGDPEALYNLAVLFHSGKGVERDLQQFYIYMLRAAEAGVPRAQSRLALAYATGDGVVKDPLEAHKWLLIAAENHDETAKVNLAHSETLLDADQLLEARRRYKDWGQRQGVTKMHQNNAEPGFSDV